MENKIMFKLVDEILGGEAFENFYLSCKGANAEADIKSELMTARERKHHHIYVTPVRWSTDQTEWAAYDEEGGGFWEELPCDSDYNRSLIVGCYNDNAPSIKIDRWNDGLYIAVREAIETYIPNDYIQECRNDEMQDFEIVDDILDTISDDMRDAGLYLFDYEKTELDKRLAFEVDNIL